MGDRINTAREVQTRPVGLYGAGSGLYLAVNNPTARNPKGSRNWLLRFTSPITGKRREMGLGSAGAQGLSLAEARERALELRKLVRSGLDPIEVQKSERMAARAEARRSPEATFGVFADRWLDDNEEKFQNPKHRAQWRMTLNRYAAPLRDKTPAEITTQDVLDTLKPIWREKPETAKRTQGRIERVLDAAKAAGLREGENPARWRGHLKLLLSARPKASRGHHAALPYRQMPEFIEQLQEREGTAARALEFLILTAARSGEVRGARWEEIDLDARRWNIPAERMKAGKPHRVPLTDRAIEILARMGAGDRTSGLVFPGAKAGMPMSDMTLAAVLKRMGYGSVTVHGFRSTFRDWAEDVAGFPYGIIKAALAHTIADKTDAAYRRGDAFERRLQLMRAWEAHMVSAASDNVVKLRG